MQTKKDEIKWALLEAGLRDMMDHGYEGASIRRISRAAGTTLGNFYHYFDSKQALFDELVQDEYQAFRDFIDLHREKDADVNWETIDPSSLYDQLPAIIEKMLPPMTDRMLLLLTGSRGTPYEYVREELVALVRDHYQDHMTEFGYETSDDGFSWLLARQFINGLVAILSDEGGEDHKKQLLARHLHFYLMGVMGILGLFPGQSPPEQSIDRQDGGSP